MPALKPSEPAVWGTTITPRGSLETDVVQADCHLKVGVTLLDASVRKTLLPSINRWWVLGPLEKPSGATPPDAIPVHGMLDTTMTYTGKHGDQVGWREVERTLSPETDITEEFVVDFNRLFGRYTTDAVAYALTYLHAPEDMNASLAIGSDDGVIVWVNGEEVYRHPEDRLQTSQAYQSYVSKENRVPVCLRKGVNTLLVKVHQSVWTWLLSVSLETTDGRPLPQVTTSLSAVP